MRISKSRHIKANMGNYESFDFGATATVDHGDLGYTDEAVQLQASNESFRDSLVDEMHAFAEKVLDKLLIDEVESARDLTEEDRSILLRAFTSQGSDTSTHREQSAPTRRPRRPRASSR